MSRHLLAAAALFLGVAAGPPSRSFDTMAPAPNFSFDSPVTPKKKTGPPGFTPAPTPNADAAPPIGPRASRDTQVSPQLFQRSNQYRGEGYSPGSSSQIQQDRRAQPGGGINLLMPLQ